MRKSYSWESVDPNAWIDVDLTVICDMEEEERLAFLGSLTFDQKKALFKKKSRLTHLINGEEDDLFKRRKKKLRHLNKKPGNVFWDYAEYYGGEKQVNGFLKDCLVSTRGDVVWLDRIKCVLHIYSSNEKGKKKELKAVKLLGVAKPYYVDRLVGCTFVNPPNQHAYQCNLKIKHINGYANNNSYTNLEWDTFGQVVVKKMTYCVEIVTPGHFYGKKFLVKCKNLLRYGFSKKELKDGFTGYRVYPKGCKITKPARRTNKFDDYSLHEELIAYLKTTTFNDVVYDLEYQFS